MELAENFIKVNNSYTIDNLENALQQLEKARQLKLQLERVAKEISACILKSFQENNISEFDYKDKVIKPGHLTKYNCERLISILGEETRQKLMRYMPLRLNKRIINQAIEDKALDAKSFQDYLIAGLIEKETKQFVKFCDPEIEQKRIEKWNEIRLKKKPIKLLYDCQIGS